MVIVTRIGRGSKTKIYGQMSFFLIPETSSMTKIPTSFYSVCVEHYGLNVVRKFSITPIQFSSVLGQTSPKVTGLDSIKLFF